MIDIYEYLKMDHKKVSELFAQFEKSTNPVQKTEVVEMIIKELMLHANSEQATFYKVLERFEESKDEAYHGEQEHKKIEDAMNDIVSHKEYNKHWENKVLRLKELVEHHVHDEEGKMFKKAKKVISDDEALVLKEVMHDYKMKLLQGIEA